MKPAIAIGMVVLCGSVIATPVTHMRSRALKRDDGQRFGQSNLQGGRNSSSPAIHVESVEAQKIEYYTNWAGAVQNDNGITVVSATANVPYAYIPAGGSENQYGGSAWVGIDGSSCGNAILQTGFEWLIQDGQLSYNAWYEWWPAYSYTFNIAIRDGDKISMKVVATSSTSGTAYLSNLSTGKSVSHTFTGQSHALCETNAEWIVEDFGIGNNENIPFAGFDPVTFTGASYTANGVKKGTSNAIINDIEQNNKVLTDCSTPDGSTVKCSYTG